MMRHLLHLLTVVALLFAPLAPAAAISVVAQTKVNCADMKMAASEHQMPANDHGSEKACCIAVPPAISPPLATVEGEGSIGPVAFVAEIEPFRLGAGPKAEDPPPRFA